MDITYLLFLQNFRLSINDALTPLMEGVSLFAVTYIFLLPAVLYWCINKRSGLFVLASFVASSSINPVIKLTACVYRPWVRDARIIPAGDAIKTAGGYSFPSGHTMTATPIYGGLAVTAWKSGKKLACFIWVALILLTGFSRNYLGVHTPQDVFVGLCVGSLCIYVVAKLFRYIDAHREKENFFLFVGFLAGVAFLLYTQLKSYPMDYVNGKLLVDPQKMKVSGIGDIAMIFGFTLGRYVERKYINFTPTGLGFKGVILGALGLAVLSLVLVSLKPFLYSSLGAFWGRVAYGSLTMFYITAVWPAVIKLFSRNK